MVLSHEFRSLEGTTITPITLYWSPLAYEISTFLFTRVSKAAVCRSNTLSRSRNGRKPFLPTQTCLRHRSILVVQTRLLKCATKRKTHIAKNGITRASVTARRLKRLTRAFTVVVFAKQTTQCYNVRNVASLFLALLQVHLNQRTKTD